MLNPKVCRQEGKSTVSERVLFSCTSILFLFVELASTLREKERERERRKSYAKSIIIFIFSRFLQPVHAKSSRGRRIKKGMSFWQHSFS